MKYLYLFLIFSLPLNATQGEAVDGSARTALIVYKAKTESSSTEGSLGSSNSRSAIIERTIGEKNDAIEVEYSFPDADIPEIEAWKLPARVLINPGAPLKLLNKSEIEARLERYLEKHPDIRRQCGSTIFTWIALEIHCDTDHVLDVVQGYNLYLGELFEGQPYIELGALNPSPLRKVSSGTNNQIYEVELVLDPELLQAGYQKSMENAAAITGGNVQSMINSSLKLSEEDKPEFSGKRLIIIETDNKGQVSKIRRRTETIINGGGSYNETLIQHEMLERQAVD